MSSGGRLEGKGSGRGEIILEFPGGSWEQSEEPAAWEEMEGKGSGGGKAAHSSGTPGVWLRRGPWGMAHKASSGSLTVPSGK